MGLLGALCADVTISRLLSKTNSRRKHGLQVMPQNPLLDRSQVCKGIRKWILLSSAAAAEIGREDYTTMTIHKLEHFSVRSFPICTKGVPAVLGCW